MLRARANGETFVSATMCPRLPGPIRHRNQLTVKAWEKAVQELGKLDPKKAAKCLPLKTLAQQGDEDKLLKCL